MEELGIVLKELTHLVTMEELISVVAALNVLLLC